MPELLEMWWSEQEAQELLQEIEELRLMDDDQKNIRLLILRDSLKVYLRYGVREGRIDVV